MDAHSDPRAEYTRRLAARQADAARAARADDTAVRARQAVLAVGAVLAWFAFWSHAISGWWLAAPAAVLAAVAIVHGRVVRTRRIAERRAAFYAGGIARLDHQWAGKGVAGDAFLDPDHPYAADLDLFGAGSLFELLCTARTRAGEATLASWLLAPSAPDVIAARQDAVRELAPLLDLREDLALLGDEIRIGVHPERLAAWGAEPFRGVSPWVRALAALLAVAGAVALSLWVAGLAGALLFALTLAADLAVALPLRSRVLHVVRAADLPGHELALLSDLLARIEREPLSTLRLAALRDGLETGGAPPSRRIARLRRLVNLLDARRNQVFAPVSYLLLWGTQFASAIEAWRAESGPAVAGWFAAVGEFEALCALAGYAWEHPDDPFPAVASADRAARFDGEGLGHPLLPQESNVRNNVRLAAGGREGDGPAVLVVSGSNMSGKSTLLRTVGVNAVLAFAGAPVRATRLQLTPLAIGATLRIQDSLQGGRSRFYAEVTRLRAIVTLAQGEPAALFLLDELLNGTNSHDRRVGAEALVGGLVGRGAIGLVTTHDLALAEIAAALGERAANVHFQDHIEDGRMVFDFRCRPGTVTRSNALALMRAVGLDV
jgi:hypothetical protein